MAAEMNQTAWEYARRRRCQALGYLEMLCSSRSATRRGMLEVGRALRAVDTWLKEEWIRWAEDSIVSCGGRNEVFQHDLHPPGEDPLPTGKARTSTCLLEGVARISRGAKVQAAFTKEHPAASLADRSLKRRDSPHRRRRRRLRAWCSKAWGSFRPTTNADLLPPPNEAPAHELVFMRKGYDSAFEEPRAASNVPDDRVNNPLHPGAGVIHRPTHDTAAGRCPMGAVTEEDRAILAQAIAFGRRPEQEQLPVLVPCLRSGIAVDLTSAAATAAATAEALDKEHERSAEECREAFPAAANDDGRDGQCFVRSEQEGINVGRDFMVEEGGGTPAESYGSEHRKRTKGMVAASVRAGDWILPTHGLGSLAWRGTSIRGGGGGTVSKEGNKGGRWMRVEAVSIGDEPIILATPGTGGTINPKLRASLTLLRLGPALLPGALVVRHVPPSARSGWNISRGDTDGGGCRGDGYTEAFRLPVLCARWGLSVLREWAAADTASKALDTTALSEENAQRNQRARTSRIRVRAGLDATSRCNRSQREDFPVHVRRKSGNKSSREDHTALNGSSGSSGSERGCFNRPPVETSPRYEAEHREGIRGDPYGSGTGGIKRRVAPGREGRVAGGNAGSACRRRNTTNKETATAGEKGLGDCVRLRLTAPAGERDLSLAWTAASVAHFGDEVLVELFTPGGQSRGAWMPVYRGLAGRFDVAGLEPCRRYCFRARLSTSGRLGVWRHTSFCTRPDQPCKPLVTRWTAGAPAVGFDGKNASSADKLAMGEGCAPFRGTCRWRNLHLQLESGDSSNLAWGPKPLHEDCSTWVVEFRARLKQLWCTENQAALEWAGDAKPKRVPAVCDTDHHQRPAHHLGSVGSSENAEGSSSNIESETEFEDHGNRRRRDSGTEWKLVYRGKRPECVVGSLAQGTHYAFRCAKANADGLVGPWSNNLRCLVPAAKGKPGGSSGNKGDALARTKTPPPPPPATPVLQNRRFDLLVPALVEAFARLVDDGEHRISHGTTHTTGRVMRLPRQMPPPPPPPPPPPSSPPSRGVEANQTAPETATTTTAPQTEGASGPRGHHHEHHQSSGMPLSWEGKASALRDETRRTVWEEHWDSERRAPFFRLRGQDLSVWQIPALQGGTEEYSKNRA